MPARNSSVRRVLAAICGAVLACAITGPQPVALCDPKAGRSQAEIHPAPRGSQGSGNPVLELPANSSHGLPGLRSQGAEDSEKQREIRGQNALEVPRVDQMSQRLLGCWIGETDPAPVKWEVVSPAGRNLGYSRDRIRLCLSDAKGELRVRYADAKDADPSPHPYGIVFRPVRAVGKQVDMAVKSWDYESETGYLETGTARCVLNPDDTVNYSHSITTYLGGKPALKAQAHATLKRDAGSR